MQTTGCDDLDRETELALEIGDLTSAAVLNGVGELGVKLDTNARQTARRRARLDATEQIQADMEAAIAFAEQSPDPVPEDLMRDIYS